MSDFDLRHERTKAMIGSDALQKLKDAHVTVFGVGGVGCYCIEALARAGIGSLTLIDGDVFSVSKLFFLFPAAQKQLFNKQEILLPYE